MASSLLVLIVAVYAATATAYIEARRRREAAPRWARIAGPLGAAMHLAGLSLLAAQVGRSPFGTSSEALSFLAFSLVGLYLLLEWSSGVASHGASFYWLATILCALAVPGLIEASHTPPTLGPRSALRSLHIGLGLLGTASVLVSGLLAMAYLNAYRRVKRGKLRHGTRGLSLSGFQRLARNASLLSALLLLPSLLIGFHLATEQDAPKGLLVLTAFTAALFVMLTTSWIIWWRRPLRGANAAWINVGAALLLFLALAIVHPLVIGAGS